VEGSTHLGGGERAGCGGQGVVIGGTGDCSLVCGSGRQR